MADGWKDGRAERSGVITQKQGRQDRTGKERMRDETRYTRGKGRETKIQRERERDRSRPRRPRPTATAPVTASIRVRVSHLDFRNRGGMNNF